MNQALWRVTHLVQPNVDILSDKAGAVSRASEGTDRVVGVVAYKCDHHFVS
jgi:hypothetical protein